MTRQHTVPYIINDATCRPLRLAQVAFQEEWLQGFIFTHHQALPIGEIEPMFGSLIPVCRELGTPAGPIDVVFINQAGLLTLVECKLWKNPEARREAVGQILDYAKEITRWSYEDLSSAVHAQVGRSLYEIVSGNSEELDESEFIDDVARNLKRGRFLLLIAGDGIRESVELIADFLQRHAHLNFSFALVEVGIFQLPEEISSGYIIQPRIIAQTVEIERAVIRIEDDKITSQMPTDQDNLPSTAKRTKISEQAFLDALEDRVTSRALGDFFAKARSIGLSIQSGQNSIKLKFTSGDKEFNFGVFRTNGNFQNYSIALTTEEIGHPEIGESYLDQLASLLKGAYVYSSSNRFQWTVKKKENDSYFSISEFLAVQDEWLELIQKIMGEIDMLQNE